MTSPAGKADQKFIDHKAKGKETGRSRGKFRAIRFFSYNRTKKERFFRQKEETGSRTRKGASKLPFIVKTKSKNQPVSVHQVTPVRIQNSISLYKAC